MGYKYICEDESVHGKKGLIIDKIVESNDSDALSLEDLINNDNKYVRIAAAEAGLALNILKNDLDEDVRVCCLYGGLNPKELLKDESFNVQYELLKYEEFHEYLYVNSKYEPIREFIRKKNLIENIPQQIGNNKRIAVSIPEPYYSLLCDAKNKNDLHSTDLLSILKEYLILKGYNIKDKMI